MTMLDMWDEIERVGYKAITTVVIFGRGTNRPWIRLNHYRYGRQGLRIQYTVAVVCPPGKIGDARIIKEGGHMKEFHLLSSIRQLIRIVQAGPVSVSITNSPNNS